jgi:hypothetical protein
MVNTDNTAFWDSVLCSAGLVTMFWINLLPPPSGKKNTVTYLSSYMAYNSEEHYLNFNEIVECLSHLCSRTSGTISITIACHLKDQFK